MAEPPEPEQLKDRVNDKLRDDDVYRDDDTLLVITILEEEAAFKFDKKLEQLSFAEMTELATPESVTKARRELYKQGGQGQGESWMPVVERIVQLCNSDPRYVNSDTALTVKLWREESRKRFDCEIGELGDAKRSRLTGPETPAKRRRELQKAGVLVEDEGVNAERLMKAERIGEFYG